MTTMTTTLTPIMNAESRAAAQKLKDAALAYSIANDVYIAAVDAAYSRTVELAAKAGTTIDALEDGDDAEYELLESLETQAADECALLDARDLRSIALEDLCNAWAGTLVASGAYLQDEADHLASRLPRHRKQLRGIVSAAMRYSRE